MTITLDLEEIEARNLAFRLRVAVRLRELLQQFGLTLEDLVAILSCAPSKETQGRIVSLRQLEDVQRAYQIVENPPFFYTMLYVLFDRDPAFDPADIPPRVQKGRGDTKFKSRAWNDHMLVAWEDLYSREIVEMRTLLDVAKSESKTVVVKEVVQPPDAPTMVLKDTGETLTAPVMPPPAEEVVAESPSLNPSELTQAYAAEAGAALKEWLEKRGLLRTQFALSVHLTETVLDQICAGRHIRTDIEPYAVLHIRTRLPIFHPELIPPRAVFTHDEWVIVERKWSHKEYWLKQLAAFALLGPDDPVPPELYAIPSDDGMEAPAEVPPTVVATDGIDESSQPAEPDQVEKGTDVTDPNAVSETPAASPQPAVSPAALQFDMLFGLLVQSLAGQLTAQIQQALPAGGSQPSVAELVESVKVAIAEALEPLQSMFESISNVQEQHTQQLRTLVETSQVQQDPGRDVSLAMRRFTRLLEEEMRKGPDQRRQLAENIGRALAKRLWMLDILTGELDQIEVRYEQHVAVGR